MPRYTIGLPDGRTMQAEANNEAEALQGAQAWYAANPKPSAPTQEPSELERLYPSGSPMEGVGQEPALPFIEGVVREAASGATANWADELAATAGRGGNMAMRAVGVDVPELSRQDILKGIRGSRKEFQTENPGFATAANIAGTVAPGVGLGLGTARALGLNPATFWGATAGGAASAGPWAALDRIGQMEGDVSTRDVLKEGATGALEGTAWGAAGGAGANALGRVVGPWASRAAQRLSDRGIRLTPGQLIGGQAQRFDDMSQDIPFLGQMARTRREEGLHDFNRVAIQDAIEPIENTPGLTVPTFTRADEPGRAMYNDAHRAVSDAYDMIVPQMRGDITEPTLINDIINIADALPQTEQQAFIANVGSYLQRADRNGTGVVRGRSMQDVIASMRDQSRRYATSNAPGTYDRELGQAFSQVADALVMNMERHSAPEVVEQFARTQQAFAQLMPVEKAVGTLGAEHGVFTPQQLLSGIKATDRTARRNAFARGQRGDAQGLAEDGKEVMTPRVGNTGTPERMFLQQGLPLILAGSTYVNPWTAALIPAAMGFQSHTGQRVFQRMATMSPQTRMMLRRAIERVSPGAGVVGAETMAGAE